MNSKSKISSNEYSHISIAILVNLVILIFAYVYISRVSKDLYFLIPIFLFIETIYLFLITKFLRRVSQKVFFDGRELTVLRNNYESSFSVMKIRLIKLGHAYVGNSRQYRIEYLNEENELNALSMFVNRGNTNFENFVSIVKETNPYAKIERFSSFLG